MQVGHVLADVPERDLMRLKWLMSVMALVTAVVVGVDLSAQQQAPAPPGGAAPQGGGGRAGGGGRGGFNLPPLLMTTDAFPDGGIVPPKYTGRGGVQPGFKFSGAPEGTMSYAIIFHDLDVAIGGNTDDVLHWIVWNIPASAGGIPEGSLPAGAVQGLNIAKQNAYFGPGAPAGPRYHHYVFELYALNANLDLPPTATRDELLKAMAGKITAKSAYVGRFRGEPPPAK
jgi:Raf kinase inhibitor-like YbhB/YbcL family protein